MVARFTSPWRQRLRPASFNGAGFHVEVDMVQSGRSIVVHEFPKKDVPYSEDMGRRARRFSITGYVLGPFYIDLRDALIAQLEAESPGWLIHPTLGEDQVACDSYSITERREAGGYATFEMQFVEAGKNPADFGGAQDTQGAVDKTVNDATGVNVTGPGAGADRVDTANSFMNSSDLGKAGAFPAVP